MGSEAKNRTKIVRFYDGMKHAILAGSMFLFDYLNQLLIAIGDDPFTGMWILFRSGGWILFLWIGLWIARELWLEHVQGKTAAKKQFIVLRVTVPRATEQTVKAVENIFSVFAGAAAGPNWTEKWIKGEYQSPLSIEIVSLEGDVSYCVRIEKRLKDLVEAAIYAQYPDADIDIIQDYVDSAPRQYPDETYDLWGTELTTVKSDAYPLKTYVDFTDQVSGEMKDPLAVVLENMSRLGPGEQLWYQIVMMPTDQKEARGRAEAEISKIKGEEKKSSPSFMEQVLLFPIEIIGSILSIFFPFGPEKKEEKKKDGPPKITTLSPGERLVLESIERKMSKIGFMCKMRVIYLARKEKMQRPKVVTPFLGAIRQFNTFNMQSLVPNSKKIGMNNAFWFYKDQRNNARKTRLIAAFADRSPSVGLAPFFLSTEELSTLWHFPILLQVKAPLLRRTQSKKTDAPANIPYADL